MITTLTGNNSYLLKAELKKQVDEFVAEQTDMGLERLDGEEVSFDRMREALESLPFLASKKLVVLQSPSANKEFTEKAETLLPEVSEATDIVIVEPKLDKRSRYFKLLQKNTDFKEFKELDEFELSKWLASIAKEKGGSISQPDAKYLVERVGANQQLLSNELAKLIAYNPKITHQSIELLTEATPQSTIFELLDAALAGQTGRALKIYEQQREMKVEPLAIIAMLAWQLHVLAIVKTAGDRDASEIAKDTKLNPYVVRKTLTIADRMTFAEIKELIHRTLELDIRLKREPIDADEALVHLLTTISK